MAKNTGKLGLGKGLSNLLGSDEGAVFGQEIKDKNILKLSQIKANKDQPRTVFDDESLNELAQSIKEHGVISPIIVREKSLNEYQIIAGERRFRASKLAGLDEIPVKIIVADDKKVAEIALIENLQREDLNSLEEALGYKELIKKYSMTQEQVAKTIGKSRSAIANSMRILALDQAILQMIKEELITSGHARAILSVENTDKHLEFAKYIADNNLNVRQAENYAKSLNNPNEKKEIEEDQVFLDNIRDSENKVQESLCRKVKIVYNKKKTKGKIVLEYLNNQDLEKLIDALSSIEI